MLPDPSQLAGEATYSWHLPGACPTSGNTAISPRQSHCPGGTGSESLPPCQAEKREAIRMDVDCVEVVS